MRERHGAEAAPAGRAAGRPAGGRRGVAGGRRPRREVAAARERAEAAARGGQRQRRLGRHGAPAGGWRRGEEGRAHRRRAGAGSRMGRSGRLGGDRVGPATAAREGEEGAAAAEGPGGGEGEGWWGMESLGYGARGDAVAGGGGSPVRPDGGEAQRPEEGARRIEVYRGVLPNGQLIAVKRSEQGSLQGSLEFRTEIELLSRVHHKNLVSLVGFCFDQGEQMLIYEYAPNGTLKDSLTGKSGVRLDWKRRLRVVLSAAKGIAYLHELADPPIVHRDIKSSNILLDERLNAKVSDFGLSKPLVQDGRGLVTTQVKGTMGYLDPEYYMTQQLTEKSDVYSFGVLLLEVISAKKPLEHGRYIVREVKGAIDRAKDLYGLHELLDPALGLGTSLGGFEQYVDLALRCVEEAGVDRPSMSEAVTEIERIMKIAGMKPAAESESNSMSSASRTPRHPYSSGDVQFDHSGGAPSSRVEPK